MNIELALTNITIVFCVIVTLSLGIFALIRSSKRRAAFSLFLLSLSVDAFYISHLVGINATDAHVAQIAFMWNLANIVIVLATFQFIYEIFGTKTKERTIVLVSSYIVGFALLVFYLIYPETFLLTPVPKLYMPFYYVPGSLYWVMRAYFAIVSAYFIIDLIRIYLKANVAERNRIMYIFIGVAYGYTLGSTAVFLVYDINVDPLYSMFFGLYTVPFIYCFLKYDLIDVHILARKALIYAVNIIFIGLLIVLVNVANNFFIASIPGFPFWLVPLVSACAVVGIGGYVWHKVSEVEKLKYEFVTVVTHKFRTPLTYIVWSADTLEKSQDEGERQHAIGLIKTGSARLVELTDLLIGLENAEGTTYEYRYVEEDVSSMIRETVAGESHRVKDKALTLTLDLPQVPVLVNVDKRRLEFALQILVENAISYTPKGGTVTVRANVINDSVYIEIKDTGIGLTEEELRYIFTEFWRGGEARRVDTEGMGIGLHIARQVIRRQGGSIQASSDGRGKGAAFTIRLSLAKRVKI
jgi:signal transduction histidine kinase